MLILPQIFESFPVIAAQSTRQNGLSKAPYHSLNLGKSTADDPATVQQNRALFYKALNINENAIALSKQVHGREVLHATAPGIYSGYDALITHTPGVFLAVSIADCTPVLIYDAQHKACAAIHAGWRGTVAGIVSHTLQQMQQKFGTQGENCRAFIGACIGLNHFEVGDEVAKEFAPAYRQYIEASGKYHVDLKAANLALLTQFGIPKNQIEVSGYCTVANNDMFFSHRLEKGITGRMLAVIGIPA